MDFPKALYKNVLKRRNKKYKYFFAQLSIKINYVRKFLSVSMPTSIKISVGIADIKEGTRLRR